MRSDIYKLEPPHWLNDKVINFYFELIADRSKKKESLPKALAMNTFFMQRLLDKGFDGVKRWTRKIDIFAYDIMIIPVHVINHWCLAIINFYDKVIRYYNSQSLSNNTHILGKLSAYLQYESRDKKKAAFVNSDWKEETMRGIPQQENDMDCGVFCCMFAECLSRNHTIVFSQKNMPYFRQRMLYEICTGRLLSQ